MTRFYTLLTAFGLVACSTVASGQEFASQVAPPSTSQPQHAQPQYGQTQYGQPRYAQPLHSPYSRSYSSHSRLFDHDYWHHDRHVPDVVQLDVYADQLAKVARHLHEDAHKLSQDYEHSEAIERFVDEVDRLQQHMHELLHDAVETGTQSTALTEHIKGDVRQVKSLFNRLYAELHHQGYDGARTEDFHAMVHMRQIIIEEAFPLARQMEIALYGYEPYDHLRSFHQRPMGNRSWIQPRVRVHHW